MLRIWHNPRCSKSRATLELLERRGLEPEVFLYLVTPIPPDMLRKALDKLALTPAEILRSQQPEWKVTGLTRKSPPEAILSAMISFPILIERPIVETATAARIGRPPDAVLEIL